jgi:hypothetical protein
VPKPKVVSVVKPVREYTSKCCNAPATKPKAGQKELTRDFDTGKSMNAPKGLGHWHCSQCGKNCSVTVGKPNDES